MKEKDMRKIARFIDQAVAHRGDKKTLAKIRKEVTRFTKKFPLYKGLRS